MLDSVGVRGRRFSRVMAYQSHPPDAHGSNRLCHNLFGMVQSERQIDNKINEEIGYFLSSRDGDVESLGKAVRLHLGIENMDK